MRTVYQPEVHSAHSAEGSWMRACFTLQRLGLKAQIRDFEEVTPDMGLKGGWYCLAGSSKKTEDTGGALAPSHKTLPCT